MSNDNAKHQIERNTCHDCFVSHTWNVPQVDTCGSVTPVTNSYITKAQPVIFATSRRHALVPWASPARTSQHP